MLAAVLAVVSAVLCIAVFAVWRGKGALEERLREEGKARATAEATLAQIEQDYQNAKDSAAEALLALSASEKNEALALQKVDAVEHRLKDFDTLKTQFEQYAKAAALTTGQELSTKLLADAQREREAAQKQQTVERETTYKQFEQFSKLANEQFIQRQQELAASLSKVQGQVDASKDQLSVLVRAMQNPIGAGAEGEIVMSNILQQHGFTQGVDYELQVHLAAEEGSLRPDCVVYLPHSHAIILDSKASQHIFALFRAEGTPEFDGAFRDIQKTMRDHAKALASKSYQDNLRKLKNRNGEAITRTTLVMFIPNDEVVTRLIHKDPNLMQYLREQDIVLAGPVTLAGLFLTARALVREAKQKDETHSILELTSELMSDFIVSLGYAEDVIKGISNSAKAYDKFGGSLRNALSKMKKLNAKGVHPAKNKAIPSGIARYSLHREDDVVQGEAEEVANVLSLPKEDAA